MMMRIRQGYNDITLVIDDVSDATDIMEALVPYCEETTSFTIIKDKEEEDD